MNSFREQAIDLLKVNAEAIGQKTATIGIDGFVDKIMRVVKSKNEAGENEFFNDIGEFGVYVQSKKGMSCGIELCERFTKLGGNAPILANSMGALGIKTNCVAALGYPEIDSIFRGLSPNCSLYTFGNPGYTTALEFNDGKIMLSQRETLHALTWKYIKDVLGLEELSDFFTKSDLVGLVNWNSVLRFNEIMRGILDDVLDGHAPMKNYTMFFDLADVSERSAYDIKECMNLISEFNKYYRVVLGINLNELNQIYLSFNKDAALPSLEEMGKYLFNTLTVDAVVVHTLKNSVSFDKDCIEEVPSLYVKKPKLSTGGGDNFNGGLCLGLMLGFDLKTSMLVANSVSGFYVRNGFSPSVENLIDTIRDWDNLIEFED